MPDATIKIAVYIARKLRSEADITRKGRSGRRDALAGILVSEANKKSPRTLFRLAGNIARSAPAECGKRAGKGVCL